MDQLKQFQLMSFGVGQSEGGISFASLGNAAGNDQAKGQEDDLPPSFVHFSELYASIFLFINKSNGGFRMGSSK